MRAVEVVVWLVLGGLAGSVGDNPAGWAVFTVIAAYSGACALPVWHGHPRLLGFCRGIAVSFLAVTACLAVGLLSLGGRP